MTLGQPRVDVDVQIMYDNLWHSIVKGTNYVYSRDPITISRGTPNEAANADPSECSFTVNNRDGMLSPRNPLSPLYGKIGRNTPIRVRAGLAQSELFGLGLNQEDVFPDTATTPDAAALDIVGDIDLAAEFTAAALDTTQTLLTKGIVPGASGTNFSYALLLGDTAGVPHVTLRWSANGTTVLAVDHAMPGVLLPATHMAVRATLDVVNGANRVITFYTSDSGTIAGPWTQHGTATTTAGNTSIFSGSAQLAVGANDTLDPFTGSVHAILVKNGIGGTAVANPVFNTQPANTTSFTDAAGRLWTLGFSAYIGYWRSTRFTGEASAWPVTWDVTGRDVYSRITAGGISRRLQQGNQAPATDPMTEFAATSGAVRYWVGDVPGDITNTAQLNSVGASNGSTGLGDLGLGSKVIRITNSAVTRDGNGYMQSGYINAHIGTYDPNHYAFGFAFRSASGGIFAMVQTGYSVSNVAAEWELVLRVDGVNNDAHLINRQNNFNTSTITVTSLTSSGALGALGPGTDVHTAFVKLDKNGTGVDWRVYIDGVTVANGTQAMQALAEGYDIHLAYVSGDTDPAFDVGYLTQWQGSSVPAAADFHDAATHYVGETAVDRMLAACTAQSIPITVIDAGSMPMGPRPNGTLLETLQECAVTDMGQLFDDRARLGLKYITRAALYDKAAALSIDYTASILAAAPNPTDDDQRTFNDVTATDQAGGSARAVKLSGPLSTQSPPAGINTYATSVQVNPETSALLGGIAGWLLNRSTVDAARYPVMPLAFTNLRVLADYQLAQTLAGLDVGDVLALTDMPAWAPSDVSALILGSTESFDQMIWSIDFNCVPYDPYMVASYATTGGYRYDAAASTVNTGFSSTATSLSIASAAGTTLWSTAATNFQVMVAGEVLTVASVTGSSSPQTFTISARHVNGVTKAHAAGEAVHIYPAPRYAL